MIEASVNSLNEVQLAAVESEDSHLLVLAGAGSGKTRVIAHRIAWFIQEKQISPHDIFSVTFTNKAAAEMRNRIESLIGFSASGLWVGTFHGLSHRLLRTHWMDVNLPENFQILDSDDQKRLVRRLMKEDNIDEKYCEPKLLQWYINKQKEDGRRADKADRGHSARDEMMWHMYQRYENACQRAGLVDFSELLLRTYEMFRDNESIRKHYQSRFKHLLVDEFQDTNTLQYDWLRCFVGDNVGLTVVGDDDQSIYGWRGAKIENIQRFSQDFPSTKVIRLEQNYRSTNRILQAANNVIENNTGRLGKELWTDGGEGEPISVYAAFNDLDEVNFVVGTIRDWQQQGERLDDAAILYRSNAQSRVIEEGLMRAGLPYRVYGGLRFFDRAEIKDALAYLRVIANEHDDTGFERIHNLPTRGIGEKAIQAVRHVAREKSISLWTATHEVISENLLPARATTALQNFVDLIMTMRENTKDLKLGNIVNEVIQQSGLIEHYKKDKKEKGYSRIENLEELVNAAHDFEQEHNEDGQGNLIEFLSHAALESSDGQAQSYEDSVQLMTLHAAKGLEFPLVFLTGMEDGLFPHEMSMDTSHGLEEERRLCYVGITRAMKKLYLTHSEVRHIYGREKRFYPSRFINEISSDLLEHVRRKSHVRPTAQREARYSRYSDPDDVADCGINLGQGVVHPKFGDGVLISVEGSGPQARVQVRFQDHGVKWLVAGYANLQPIE